MFVTLTLAGLKRTVTKYQVRALEAMGWTRVPGAEDEDAVKKDAPLQKSPKKKGTQK